MKLIDLEPRWVMDADIILGGEKKHYDNRTGMGLSFNCPHCSSTRLAVWFANPIDGLPPTNDATHLWNRTGDTFESLTLTPSIDASAYGHFHGYITNGQVQ